MFFTACTGWLSSPGCDVIYWSRHIIIVAHVCACPYIQYPFRATRDAGVVRPTIRFRPDPSAGAQHALYGRIRQIRVASDLLVMSTSPLQARMLRRVAANPTTTTTTMTTTLSRAEPKPLHLHLPASQSQRLRRPCSPTTMTRGMARAEPKSRHLPASQSQRLCRPYCPTTMTRGMARAEPKSRHLPASQSQRVRRPYCPTTRKTRAPNQPPLPPDQRANRTPQRPSHASWRRHRSTSPLMTRIRGHRCASRQPSLDRYVPGVLFIYAVIPSSYRVNP